MIEGDAFLKLHKLHHINVWHYETLNVYHSSFHSEYNLFEK